MMLALGTWSVLGLGASASLTMLVYTSEACFGVGSWMLQLYPVSSTTTQTTQALSYNVCRKCTIWCALYWCQCMLVLKVMLESSNRALTTAVEPLHQLLFLA